MDPAPLLAQMIRAAASGPHAVLSAVEEPLLAMGFTARVSSGEPRAVLWTRGAPRLLLSGHVDVVPDGEGWARDPHGGEVAEGAVWGRGACDMLGAIACFVAAARASDAPCAILLTTDEETGMKAAEVALAEGFARGFEAAVVGEPTAFAVGIAEKGVLWVRLRTRGRNAHGSMPELGDNAAERLVRVLGALGSVRLDGRHPLLGAPTRNLGRLESGEAVNQVPASARAEIDLRYLPGQRKDDIIAALRAASPETFEIEIMSDHAPFETPRDAAIVRAASRAVEAAGRGPARIVGLPYGTEASKLAPAGIPSLILGPGDPALAHTHREHVTLDALRDGAAMYAALLEAYR